MSTSGDYDDEMFRRNHLDDQKVEQILSGRTAAEDTLLASFVEDVAFATSTPVQANKALATLFAEGLSADNGDLLVTAASNVPGPAPQAAGLPKRRNKMIAAAAAAIAKMSLAKVAVAGAVVATGGVGTAAAATGNLPEPVQAVVAEAVANVGVDIPTGSEDVRQDGEHRRDEENFGTDVSDRAQTTDEKDADFGKGIAEDAPSGDHADDAGSQADDAPAGSDAADEHTADVPEAPETPAGGAGTADQAPAGAPEGAGDQRDAAERP